MSQFGRSKRNAEDVDGIGESGKGTNMARINMDYERRSRQDIDIHEVGTDDDKGSTPLLPILIALSIFLLLCLLIIIVFVR